MSRLRATLDGISGGAMAMRLVARSLVSGRRPAVTLTDRIGQMAATLPVRQRVVVHWNAHQIPFIEAADEDDLAVALGAVHAHLRLSQMEMLRRLAAGRIAETVGPLGLPLDKTVRLFDFGRAAPAIIDGLSEPTRRWAEGFLAGVNHQIAHGPVPEEFRLLRITAEPWTMLDLFTTARLASADVSWIVWSRLLKVRRRLSREAWREVWPQLLGEEPGVGGAADPLTIATRAGSNAAVVGGRRSSGGAGLLAADPHLSTALPNIWVVAGLTCPSINAVGVMPAGFPIIAIGRNQWIAWGGTSLHAASSDLFDASGLPLRSRKVDIKVRGHGTRSVTLRESELGPVVSDGLILRHHTPIALRWVGHQRTDEMGAMLTVMRARSAEEFRAALADFAVPAQNMVHASRDGRVGHLLAARLPCRPAAAPADLVLPPEAASAWDNMVGTSDLPHWLDPPEGFAVSANDRPPPGAVPVGFFFSAADRAERMRELLSANASVTPDDMAALQNDVLGRGSLRVRDALLARLTPGEAAHPVSREIAAWDGRYDGDSAGALAHEALIAILLRMLRSEQRRTSLAAVWTGRAMLLRELVGAPDAALHRALARGLPRAARVVARWRTWSGAHRLALRHQLAALPVIGLRFRFGDVPGAGSNDTLNKTGHRLTPFRHQVTFGASARFIADMSEPDANRVVLLGAGWLARQRHVSRSGAAVAPRGVYRSAVAPGNRPLMAASHRARTAPRPLMYDAGPLLRLYAQRRLRQLAALDPAAAQRAVLRRLIARGMPTRFGRVHGFSAIRSIGDYQHAVKLRSYEAFWEEWWRAPFPRIAGVTWAGPVPYFANSSGTTGGPTKRIPVSLPMIRANRRAALDVLVHHVAHRPGSRVMAGAALILGGSTALERLAPGIHAGDLSGIMAAEVPLWAQSRTFPPREIALLGDWAEKMARTAAASLDRPITSLSGTPSWMVLFFEQVAALRDARVAGGARLADCYPDLELVIHGGVGFAPYRDRFAHWLAGSRAETREVYPASEGFFAIADRREGEGMRLLLDNGIFYEFVRPGELDRAAPDRRWIANAEVGVDYAIVVTTNAGLWSYVVGDTVTLVDRDPPRVLVTGRTSWSLSVVGEHLIGAELDAGIEAAARAAGVTVTDYAAAAVMPDASDQRAGHVFVVELAPGQSAPAAFARALDARLAAINEDYAAHRRGDVGMRPPLVRFMPAGGFAGWMQSRGKLGGQNKVPRVISDAAVLAGLLQRLDEISSR